VLKHKSVVVFSNAGCFLPFLIIFNLLFGWIFFKPIIWLFQEAILILLFMVHSYILLKRNFASPLRRSDAIDVKAQVLDEEKRK